MLIASYVDYKQHRVPVWILFAELAEIVIFKGISVARVFDAVFVLLVLLIYATITDAIGGGDVKLAAILALGFGAVYVFLAFALALVLLFVYDKFLKNPSRKKFYPLVPFLTAGFCILLVAGI